MKRTELRNPVGKLLRQVEAGEEFVLTVWGRPVAELGPTRPQAWVPALQLTAHWELSPDPALMSALSEFDYGLRDPWDAAPAA